MNISYVITIDFSGGGVDILLRLKNILNIFSRYQGIEVVVSIALRNKMDFLFLNMLNIFLTRNNFHWCNLIPLKVDKNSLLNNSILRNIAVKNSSNDHIFFWDVDLIPEEKIILHASEEKSDFLMYPVLYLNEFGSIKLKMDGLNSTSILDEYFRNPYLYAKHCAIPSSAIRVKRVDFDKVGGFDEGYKGHGYEDFDFIGKLLISLGWIDKTDFFADYPYNSPLMARGFRACFGEFCLENLLDKKIISHLFHKKRNIKKYDFCRNKNKEIFFKNFQSYQTEENKFNFPLLNDFLDLCQEKGLDPAEFSVFYGDGSRFGLNKGILYKIKKAIYD